MCSPNWKDHQKVTRHPFTWIACKWSKTPWNACCRTWKSDSRRLTNHRSIKNCTSLCQEQIYFLSSHEWTEVCLCLYPRNSWEQQTGSTEQTTRNSVGWVTLYGSFFFGTAVVAEEPFFFAGGSSSRSAAILSSSTYRFYICPQKNLLLSYPRYAPIQKTREVLNK